MDETVRVAMLCIFMPISIYIFVPAFSALLMMLTPKVIHDCPRCAVWTICFATFMACLVVQGSNLEKAYASVLVFILGVWWHFGKYLLIFQLTYDPILKFFRPDAAELIEDICEDCNANLWKSRRPKTEKRSL